MADARHVLEARVGDRWLPAATGWRGQRLMVFTDAAHASAWADMLNVRRGMPDFRVVPSTETDEQLRQRGGHEA